MISGDLERVLGWLGLVERDPAQVRARMSRVVAPHPDSSLGEVRGGAALWSVWILLAALKIATGRSLVLDVVFAGVVVVAVVGLRGALAEWRRRRVPR